MIKQEEGVLEEVEVLTLMDLSQEKMEGAEVVEVRNVSGLIQVKDGLKRFHHVRI